MGPENRIGIAIMELSFSIMSSSVLIATIGQEALALRTHENVL